MVEERCCDDGNKLDCICNDWQEMENDNGNKNKIVQVLQQGLFELPDLVYNK